MNVGWLNISALFGPDVCWYGVVSAAGNCCLLRAARTQCNHSPKLHRVDPGVGNYLATFCDEWFASVGLSVMRLARKLFIFMIPAPRMAWYISVGTSAKCARSVVRWFKQTTGSIIVCSGIYHSAATARFAWQPSLTAYCCCFYRPVVYFPRSQLSSKMYSTNEVCDP